MPLASVEAKMRHYLCVVRAVRTVAANLLIWPRDGGLLLRYDRPLLAIIGLQQCVSLGCL